MKAFKYIAIFIAIAIYFLFIGSSALGQSKYSNNRQSKYSLSISLGYDYTVSNANGDVNGFSSFKDPKTNFVSFDARNYGMQGGGSLVITGKMAVDKRKQLKLISSLGYTLFYNTRDGGLNRTKWSIFNLGAGVEYNLRNSSKSRPFINFMVDYNLLFGAWQTDVTFPDNSISNIYVKFLPENRLGISIGTGAEFKVNKKTSIIAGLRGVWVNITPKSDNYTISGYEAFINDSRNLNGTSYANTKQIIYMQIYSGVSFNLF